MESEKAKMDHLTIIKTSILKIFLCHAKIARTAESFSLLPACIRLMNPPNPLRAVYFSTEKYNYDPSNRKTDVSASQTSQRGSLSSLLKESRSRDAPLTLHLMLRRKGRKEGGREGENEKRNFIFFPPLTEAVHKWVGLD